MDKLDGLSFDNVRDRMEQLKCLFPEAVSEGRLDYDMLMALLGDEFASDSEKYRFEWKGKLDSLRLAQKRSGGTLRPDFDGSREWETTGNLYIEGDNLEVLKLLQQGYLRKVKMIYIDPPYNTGNDFVYEDDFADPIAKYRAVTGQGFRANPETAGRYHSNWLSMMYPRLKLAKTLLRDDGVIFISIDDNEVHNLRKLCDEVFGEENFLAQIVWEKKFSPQNDAKYFSLNHEYLLVYARTLSSFDRNLLPMTEEQKARYTNPDNDPRGPWTASDLTRAEYRERDYYAVITPSGKEVFPAKGRSWNRPPQEIERLKEDGRLWFGADLANVPRLKRYLSEIKQGMVPISIWYNKEVGHTQAATQELIALLGDKYFDFPKPASLISRCIRLCCDKDSLILDFFSGSATTAHAVMQLNAEDGGNRRFIMVQIPEPTAPDSEAHKAGYRTIADIGKERIRRAGDKVMSDWREKQTGQMTLGRDESAAPPDIGFRVFKLDSSNIAKWDDTYVPSDQMELLMERMERHLGSNIKHDRRDIDVVYEVFLKYGIPLTEKLATLDIQGKQFFVAGETGYLFLCLAEGLTTEIVEEAAQYAPGTMFFCDECFADTNALTNAALVLERAKIELRWV